MTLLTLVIITILIYYLLIYRNDTNLSLPSKQNTCRNCGSRIEKDFNVCPICKESLRKPCPICGKTIEAHWNYCPYCESKVIKDDRS